MTFALRPVIALSLALALAGCGVKGGLEPPPDSGISPNAVAAYPATVPAPTRTAPGSPLAVGTSPGTAASARSTTSSAVINAPAAQKSNPLDWLIE